MKVSHPARGAWIEISTALQAGVEKAGSHPARGAWIEIPRTGRLAAPGTSHPARGAWIEI